MVHKRCARGPEAEPRDGEGVWAGAAQEERFDGDGVEAGVREGEVVEGGRGEVGDDFEVELGGEGEEGHFWWC